MKIVQLAKFYPPAVGGIENNVHALAHLAAAEGHESVVLASNHGSRSRRRVVEHDGPVRVERLPSWGSLGSLPLTFGWVRALHRERGASVVHLHAPNPLAELACLIAAQGRTLVVTDHGPVGPDKPGSRIRQAFYRAVIRRSRAVVTYTRAYARSSPLAADFEGKLRVIPHGTDGTKSWRTPHIEARAKATQAEARGPIILFVGRLVAYKGVDVLLEAFERIEAPSVLFVVGDGPERARLEGQAAGLRRAGDIQFLGQLDRERLLPYYAAAAVFVLPSLSSQESFGQTLVEAALMGTPAVASRLESGVREIVKHEVTGLLVAPGDPQALAEAVGRLLGDTELRTRLGQAAHALADRQFVAEAVASEVASLYAEVGAR